MKKVLFLFTAFILVTQLSFGQELNVEVKINTPKLQTTDPKVFESLETSMREFMTNQQWTDDVFEPEERITVNIQLTIDKEVDAATFEGELSIQAVRPVFNSSYETVLITHRDQNVRFTYEQYQPLQYSENVFNDNLTSILAFYSYVIIGMDYDSFSLFGGTPYFQKAQEILNNVPPGQAARFKGWRSLDGNRNRYWIVENLLSPRVRPYREAMYNYHRQSLDIMSNDALTGRAIMTQALESLQEVNRSYPSSMILQMFSNAKSSEIVEIYKEAPIQEKNKVITVMTRIDASNASKYNEIRKAR